MIISCYRLKPIQLPEKTESRQRVSKAEQQETRKFPEPDPREGFRGVGSPRSNFIFEGSFAEFSSFLRLTANGLAEAYEQTRISWAEVLSLQLSKFPLLRPLPPPFNEQISIRCSGLQFKSFAVFGISWNRVVPSNCHYCFIFNRLFSARLPDGIWNFWNEFRIRDS